MADPRYLVDASVLGHADIDEVADLLERLALAGKLWTCTIIDVELAYASRARVKGSRRG